MKPTGPPLVSFGRGETMGKSARLDMMVREQKLLAALTLESLRAIALPTNV